MENELSGRRRTIKIEKARPNAAKACDFPCYDNLGSAQIISGDEGSSRFVVLPVALAEKLCRRAAKTR
jgi:hypothetical protein